MEEGFFIEQWTCPRGKEEMFGESGLVFTRKAQAEDFDFGINSTVQVIDDREGHR